MPGEDTASFWRALRPAAWPEAPTWMSFSTLREVETCPRRWALNSADYPNAWKHRGYPRPPHPAALEGTVVHLSLRRITSALVARGCPSLVDESAIFAIRELGGFTAVILDSLERALHPYEGNPRAVLVLDGIRHRLAARVPELRSRVQRFLSRIRPESRTATPAEPVIPREQASRSQLQHGSHAEVELQAPGFRWHGVADLLTLSPTSCEIRDYKTGTTQQEHEFQLRTYALLWARDRDLNPPGRLADRLVLSYDDRDIDVPAPRKSALASLEHDLRERTTAALAALQGNPPEARPSVENCAYCTVRHLCEEYWQWQHDSDSESPQARIVDLQIELTGHHGPRSWDGIVELASGLKRGRPVVLRSSGVQRELHPGQRVRLLDVHLSLPSEDTLEEEAEPVVATMTMATEAFVMPHWVGPQMP